MKPLSFRNVAMVIALLVLCSYTVADAAKRPTGCDTFYYFYSADTDSFVIYSTVNAEIARLEDSLQVFVDNDPLGGSLVERAYVNSASPHNTWPAEYMYAHY